MAEHEPSIGVVHSAGVFRGPRTSPSHGENRGSSPLGSANDNNGLAVIIGWSAKHQTNTGANIILVAGCTPATGGAGGKWGACVA